MNEEQLFQAAIIGCTEIVEHLGMVWVCAEDVGSLDFCMHGTWFAVDFHEILARQQSVSQSTFCTKACDQNGVFWVAHIVSYVHLYSTAFNHTRGADDNAGRIHYAEHFAFFFIFNDLQQREVEQTTMLLLKRLGFFIEKIDVVLIYFGASDGQWAIGKNGNFWQSSGAIQLVNGKNDGLGSTHAEGGDDQFTAAGNTGFDDLL